MPTTLPWRGDATGAARPADLEPLPPARMAVLRGGRPLKRWRYVGVYGPELMLCAGVVRIGGVPQAFWAVWDRDTRALRERTRLRRAAASALPDGAARVRDARRRDRCSWSSPPGDPVEIVSRARRAAASGRASCRVRAHGHGRRSTAARCGVDAAGLRRRLAPATTRARPRGSGAPASATSAAGEPVAWNLVDRRARRAAGQRAHGVGRRRAARGAAGRVRRA